MYERKDQETVLEIRSLSVDFQQGKTHKPVVQQLSLTVRRSEIVVLLGESGCGKTVTASTVMGLTPRNAVVTGGEILLGGEDLLKLSERQLCRLRGNRMGMIFQDAPNSLNPLLTVGTLVEETILAHGVRSKSNARKEAEELLRRMQLPDPEKLLKAHPYELSGGMCQRVMIAIAMARNPDLLLADEPTTALDVTIQAGILQEICRMAKSFRTGVLFITHDLGIAAEIADYIYVMRSGSIVDQGTAEKIFRKPSHPYSKQLIDSIF